MSHTDRLDTNANANTTKSVPPSSRAEEKAPLVSALTFRPHHPPFWISAWFLVSTLIVLWDVGYLTFRPRSMAGGDLVHIWWPYMRYAKVDHVYGWPAFESRDGWPLAQSGMNVVECVCNFTYLYMAHVRKDPVAVLVAFMSVTATFTKTVLYFLIEILSGFRSTKQNDLKTMIFLYIAPNGVWIIVPALLMWILGREVGSAIRFAAQAAKKAA